MLRVLRNFSFNGSVFDVFSCDKAGDELPLHDHTFNHLTVVMNGEIEAFNETGDTFRAVFGDAPLEYKAGRKHGIRALTDGAVFINISPSFTPS